MESASSDKPATAPIQEVTGTPAESADNATSPLIWMIVGDRLGDNAQVETLVSGLGMPVVRKYVCVKDPWIKGKPKVIPSLHHLDIAKSDALGPPWPDLIITVGRRLSMVALWVKEQAE